MLVGIRSEPGVVDVIDTTSLKRVKSIAVDGGVHNVYVTPDGKYAVSGSIQHIIGFSNYQVSNGILFPLSIAESVDGQSTWSLALTSVTFNTGLSDSDFQF